MPLRRYIVIQPDGADGEEFEVDLPAEAPCRRVLESPTLTTKYGEGAMKQGLSDQRLARAGFQKLEKDGQGGWNKIN